MGLGFEGSGVGWGRGEGGVSAGSGSRGVWDWLWFSCGAARSGGGGDFLFFGTFLLVLAKLSFWWGPWALGYHSMVFRHFPDIS